MFEKNKRINKSSKERVILVGLVVKNQSKTDAFHHLKELVFLSQTAGAKIIKTIIQHKDKPNPATFIGKGKLFELKDTIFNNQIDTVIFDDELSPTQQKNLQEFLNTKVIDRAHLILDIFAHRAKTAHAKIQVELAQYQYILPRLTRLWTHLERQRGGIGTRGPGEQEIETDRRIIRDKIAYLKKKLLKIDRQKSIQRKNRGKLVRVALVGYTNTGKSTLLNLFAKTNVLVEDKLFATLDTKVRRIVIKNLPFLLTDTVGFIHKLPHCLFESFKATLDEVREADILLHIIDLSHPRVEEQIEVVNSTLRELKSENKAIINVYNKIDRLPDKETFINSTNHNNHRNINISATQKINIIELKELLYQEAKNIHLQRYPYNDLLFPDKLLAKP